MTIVGEGLTRGTNFLKTPGTRYFVVSVGNGNFERN